MKIIEKFIDQGQYLEHIFADRQIPSNIILFKTLPGLGATYLEILSNRHSIIIEPNVPVIESKFKKNKNKVLGIYSKTTKEQIIKYLTDPKIEYKKILCTPESFEKKVIDIMVDLGVDLYNDYFLLFDECDRTAKDVDFRKDIIIPMSHFFKFKNKSFVSATAVIPSDRRFVENRFEIIKIVPTFTYQRRLNLIVSNNPKTVLKDLLEEFRKKDYTSSPIFIFFNSAKGITSIIEQFRLSKDTTVFCGAEAKESLKKSKAKPSFRVCDEVNETTISKYNFLTSRYYSALDIDLPEGMHAHVIVFTDLNAADHSIIDPYSDLIQIPGRFRNTVETPQRLKSFTFITNIKKDMPYKTKDEAKGYIDGIEDGYNNLITLRDSAPNQGFKDLMQEAIERVFFSAYINEDGTKNYFMYDNYFHKEKLKSYYTDVNLLKIQFIDNLKDDFLVNFREVNHKANSFYANVTSYKNYRERIMEVIELLEQINQPDSPLFSIQADWSTEIEHLHESYQELTQLYYLVGKDEIYKSCFTKNDVKKMILHYKQSINGITNNEIYKELKIYLNLDCWYDQRELLNKMTEMYKKYGLPYKRTIDCLEMFYRIRIKKVKGYPKVMLLEQKFK